jgi:hypothetical protein
LRKPEQLRATPNKIINRASSFQRHAFPADAQKNKTEEVQRDRKLRKCNSNKKLRKQVRRETKQSTARAQQRIFRSCRSNKKLRQLSKAHQETPEARNSDTKIAQAQRETKKFNRASPTKSSPVTTALTKIAESRQATSKTQIQQKAAQAHPTRHKTIIKRASSTKHFPLRRSNKKPQQPNSRPRKRNSDTKTFKRASSTKFAPTTTMPTKTTKAQQDASKVQLQQKKTAHAREPNKALPAPPLMQQTAKAQQENPTAQLQ